MKPQQGLQVPTWEQAIGIYNNSFMKIGWSGQYVPVSILANEVSWETAKAYYESLPSNVKQHVKKTGQPMEQDGKYRYWNPITKEYTANPTPERGIWICQMYLKQDKKCGYCQLEYPIEEMQAEHLVPEHGDTESNILMAHYAVNQNRKQTDFKVWYSNTTKRVKWGEEAYTQWFNDRQKASAQGQQRKVEILDMSDDQLKKVWQSGLIESKYEKYAWRNIGMSSLQLKRLRKDGTHRPGGSQGNYKEVLNTITNEYLFGDKELAKSIFKKCRAAANDYVEGKIQNDTYVDELCDLIESSNHPWVKYNRETFTKKVIRNTYKWPNL